MLKFRQRIMGNTLILSKDPAKMLEFCGKYVKFIGKSWKIRKICQKIVENMQNLSIDRGKFFNFVERSCENARIMSKDLEKYAIFVERFCKNARILLKDCAQKQESCRKIMKYTIILSVESMQNLLKDRANFVERS